MDSKPFFPSDPLPRGPEAFHLAGRVVHVDSSAIWLADAFATTTVHGAADVPRPPSGTSKGRRGLPRVVAVGDLAVLLVRRSPDRVELVAVAAAHRPNAQLGREQNRLMIEGVGVNLLSRARGLAAVRSFFQARDFVEVDTPLLVGSPGLDLHLEAFGAASGFLITSPEYQMKRLLAAGVPRLYQLSHVFRREESGPLHRPEFAMIEWYRAFAGVEEVMADTEGLVTACAEAIAGGLEIRTEQGRVRLLPPFVRMTVDDAFQRFAGTSAGHVFALSEKDPDTYFRLFVEKIEPALAVQDHPIFLVDFPISQASLARAKPGDPRVAERFELYVGGVELCNGFGELTDPGEQRRRLLADQQARSALGREVYPIDERFLAALAAGMPPSAGNALGFDRLLMLCLGERDISRVLPLPDSDI